MFVENRKFTPLNPFWSKMYPFTNVTCHWLWSHEKKNDVTIIQSSRLYVNLILTSEISIQGVNGFVHTNANTAYFQQLLFLEVLRLTVPP